MKGQGGHDGVFHRLFVDGGQDAGQAQADGADITVGRGAGIGGAAAAEHLALRVELGVHLQPDNGLVFHALLCPPLRHQYSNYPSALTRQL